MTDRQTERQRDKVQMYCEKKETTFETGRGPSTEAADKDAAGSLILLTLRRLFNYCGGFGLIIIFIRR